MALKEELSVLALAKEKEQKPNEGEEPGSPEKASPEKKESGPPAISKLRIRN